MVDLGCRLAGALPENGCVVTLAGELGAGKTTLVRALLRALGVTGYVRSPTYTLIEPYEAAGRRVRHLDLYRLNDPQELEFLGIRDLDPVEELIFIEWPERGKAALPPADVEVAIAVGDDTAREVELTPRTPRGEAVIARLR